MRSSTRISHMSQRSIGRKHRKDPGLCVSLIRVRSPSGSLRPGLSGCPDSLHRANAHSEPITWQLRVLLRHASELRHEVDAHAGIIQPSARSGQTWFGSYVRSLNECLEPSDDDSPDDAQLLCALEHVRALRLCPRTMYECPACSSTSISHMSSTSIGKRRRKDSGLCVSLPTMSLSP